MNHKKEWVLYKMMKFLEQSSGKNFLFDMNPMICFNFSAKKNINMLMKAHN